VVEVAVHHNVDQLVLEVQAVAELVVEVHQVQVQQPQAQKTLVVVVEEEELLQAEGLMEVLV
jgi:hypothetical protein